VAIAAQDTSTSAHAADRPAIGLEPDARAHPKYWPDRAVWSLKRAANRKWGSSHRRRRIGVMLVDGSADRCFWQGGRRVHMVSGGGIWRGGWRWRRRRAFRTCSIRRGEANGGVS
jgi:hypothetical protein